MALGHLRYDRPMTFHRAALGLVSGLLVFVLATPTHAALGGDTASIANDSISLGGSREITHTGGLEVHLL
jgi:hypothetical protein